MAKSRAQRKAEQRRRAAAEQRQGDAAAQHDTQVPESADVSEAELAERGANLDELRSKPSKRPRRARSGNGAAAPAPSRADVGRPEQAESSDSPDSTESPTELSRREAKRLERERETRRRESEARRAPKQAAPEKRRGRILTFFASCWAELKRVQWPDRPTLVQATAITMAFIVVVSAYLGALDAVFSQLVELVL